MDINNAGVVTGRSNAGPAFRWSFGGTLELIGTLPDDDYAVGLAINESGQVAGYSADALTGPDSWHAFRFTDGAGMVGIDPTLAFRSAGVGINERGHVVGNRGTASTPERDPWVWTPERGLELLDAVFIGDPNFFGFSGASDINDRGQIITQAGRHEPFEPASGVILTPTTCAADFNGDCAADSGDFFDFLTAFFGGAPDADFNGDSTIDSDDFFDFLNAFFVGCS